MATWLRAPPHPGPPLFDYEINRLIFQSRKSRILCFSDNHRRRILSVDNFRNLRGRSRIYCNNSDDSINKQQSQSTGIQLYSEIERLLTETAKQAQGPWGGSGEWTEVEVFSDLVFAQCHMDFSFIHF